MLHMIGNAHLDPVWLWRWPEGCAEAIATCWAAVDRLDEDEGFVFTRGEASVYRWIETRDPDLFERIRGHVRDGRWAVVNGWWVQPDCNLPSGEALIRQALYGKSYFRDRLGVDVTVGYNVDSFGHAATIPMLLRHTGMDSYVFTRPEPHEKALPGELFEWESPDGSRVRAFRVQGGYQTSERFTPLARKIDRLLERSRAVGHPFLCLYGVGDHGGGPTRADLALIHARQARGEPLRFSHPARFFAEVRDLAVPRVLGEMQYHAVGCYSAGAALKALNRRCEAALEQAEAAAALAVLRADAAPRRADLARCWKGLLFNQFHDTLGGTLIESACEDVVDQLGAVRAGAREILDVALRALARTIRPVDDPRDPHLLIANLTGADCDGLLEAEPWLDLGTWTPRRLVDEEGRPVPFQYACPEGKTPGLQRIAFRAALPAFGYRLLRFARHPVPAEAPVVPGVSAGRPLPRDALHHETAGWRLVLDGETGAIRELANARDGALFTGPAHLAIAVDDPTDTWSHGVDRFGFEGEAARLEELCLIEEGPVRRVLEVGTRVGSSRFVSTVVLPEAAELPVELRVRIDWREQRRLLRLAYPLGAARFEYEIPAGWLERPDDGREVFGHRWVRAVRGGLAVLLANDATYSYAARDGTLYLTALRSPVYAHHAPIPLEDGARYRTMDQGEQRFALRVAGAPAASRRAAARLAEHLLKPPVITSHVSRGGHAPWHGQWLSLDAGTALVTSLKAAEDGEGLVVRALELEGRATRLVLDDSPVGGVDVPARSVATARLSGGRLRASDGLER